MLSIDDEGQGVEIFDKNQRFQARHYPGDRRLLFHVCNSRLGHIKSVLAVVTTGVLRDRP
jgi:hypothetical protein